MSITHDALDLTMQETLDMFKLVYLGPNYMPPPNTKPRPRPCKGAPLQLANGRFTSFILMECFLVAGVWQWLTHMKVIPNDQTS